MRKSLLYTAEIIHKISSVQTSKENQIMFTHTTKENRQYSALVATGRKENQVIALICERNGSVLQIEMLWMSQSEGNVSVLWKCLCTFSVQGTDKCKWKTLPAKGHAMTVSIERNWGRPGRGSDKWEVQTQCEEPLMVQGPPALHTHHPRRPIVKSLEVNHRKWRRWTVPTGYYDLFFWY